MSDNMISAYIVGILFLILLAAIFLGRFFAWLVEILARWIFQLDLTLDTFGFFSVNGIAIKLRNGLKIEIEKICLHNRWTLNNSKRLFTILFRSVVVNVQKTFVETHDQQNLQASRRPKSSNKFVVAHKQTISRFIRKFCQYVGFQVSSLEVLLSTDQLHGSVLRCHLPDGLQFDAKPEKDCLSSTLSVSQILTQLFTTKEGKPVPSSELAAELSCSLHTEVSFVPLESLLLATVYTNLKNVNILLLDGLVVHHQPKVVSTAEERASITPADVKPVTSAEIVASVSRIPKSVDLAVDGINVTFLSKEKRKLILEVSRVVSTLSQERDNSSVDSVQSSLNLGISGITAKSLNSCRVCTLNRLRLTSKLSCHYATIQVVSSLSVESCHYNHVQEEFSYWLEYFKSRRRPEDLPDLVEKADNSQGSTPSVLSRLPVELELTNTVEVVDCSTSVFLNSPLRNELPLCRAVLGCFTVNLKMHGLEAHQDNKARELSSSARLENSYLYMDTSQRLLEGSTDTLPDNPALLPSSTKHVWGRVLALGSCSIKLSTELTEDNKKPTVVKAVGEASSLAAEWSHDVCQSLLKVVSGLELSSSKTTQGAKLKKKNAIDRNLVSLDVDFRVSGVNLFYLGTLEGGVDSFMTRIDMALTTATAGADWQLNCGMYEMKMCRLLGLKKLPHRCVHSAELENDFITVPVATVSYSSLKATTVSLNEVIVNWDPTLHMAIHDRIHEVMDDGTRLKALLKPPLSSSVHKEKNSLAQVNFKCDISWFKLQMQTSPKTRFGVECESCSVALQNSLLEVNSESTNLFFDDHCIFKFEVMSVKRLPEVKDVLRVRQEFKQLETQTNTTWVVQAENTRLFFPFMFNFAASREELVNVFKMLRTLHKKPKDSSYVEPLPPDLWLRFENIVLEMEDDPFEVKLRDNYALLLDEMEQWNERQLLLEAKLDEIRKRPGNLLTVKKEEELRRSLQAKNSQIYIRRSQSLYEQTPMRTTLLTWEFQGLDLIVLADESYHGQEKAVHVMTQLNSDSPYPSSGRDFTTLWCRTIEGKLRSHKCRLRDFPQPIFTSQSLEMKGTLLGAEPKPAERAKREAVVEIGEPWSNMTISRSLSSLKFFYDLKFDVDTMEMAWGVDIEPVTTMVSLAFEKLSSPSRDPSKPLPFYDKMRLLYHGRLRIAISEWHLYFSASRNPYDTTERMEWEWRRVNFDWTNGRIVIDGDFDLHTRAASKYDDRRVLHLPAFKVCANMKWQCQGNAMDHHSVTACAPDKVPELAPNQVHDSYAAFRSQNLTLDICLETALSNRKDQYQSDPPTLFMYASTFRWFQKYQAVVFRYVSRPIRRGSYFGRDRVKKRSLGRHYKQVSLSLQFPELSVWYWGSFTQQRGFELSLGDGYLETTYCLALRDYRDGLVRRQAADWSASKFHSELSNVTCHLYGLEEFDGKEIADEHAEVSSIDLEPTKYYLLAASRLEYTRQDTSKKKPETVVDGPSPELQNYNHRLVCHNLKGAWTLTNRCIAFGLFEAYTNAQVLKKNLSADALKFTIVDQKGSKQGGGKESSPSPSTKGRSAMVSNMLEKLVMEKDSKFVAFTEEGTGEHEQVSETHLQGVALCSADDVIEDRWHIELVNSQILLKGKEAEGCVLVAAGNTRILNRLHTPVWSKGELFNKKTWVGNVDNLQYFATLGSETNIGLDSTPWLSTSVITGRQNRNSFDIADLANIVGSGEAVGGMVDAVVGSRVPGLMGQEPAQLQRIVARCGCEFYFVSFSADLDPVAEEHAPSMVPPSPSSHLQVDRQSAVNTFTIRHKLLDISTNSAQYAMLIDIANNVVLYTEPKKKEASDKLQRMRFHLHLSTSEDQRGQILRQQNTVRSYQNEMRRLERELYEVNLLRKQAMDDQELTDAVIQLEREISQQKKYLSEWSSDLQLMISAYKDFLMNLNTPTPEKAPAAEVTKLAEVYFNHASWQLNQEDGQLAIADAAFSNFSYRKITLSGATVEHRLELGRFHVRNLLPNSIYKDALSPLDLSGKGHVDRSVAVRIFCRVRPPVGGIGVKEHFEVNVCPLAVRMTYRMFKKVMVFFFPHRAHEYEGEAEEIDLGFRGMEVDVDEKDLFIYDEEEMSLSPPSTKSTSLKRSPSSLSSSSETSLDSTKHKKTGLSVTDSPPMSPSGKDKQQAKKKSTFYKKLNEYDDLDKMKERASKNNTFIYVKIPQVSLLVSYKGEKDRNIIDVHDFSLVIPTLEYHSRTWTWHDLLMAMKKDCVNVLVSQAIKEKLHLVGGHGTESKEAKSQAKEEDKARLLWGEKPKDKEKKSKKKLFSKLAKIKRKRKGLLHPDGAGPEPVDLEEEDDFDELGQVETDGKQEDAEGSGNDNT